MSKKVTLFLKSLEQINLVLVIWNHKSCSKKSWQPFYYLNDHFAIDRFDVQLRLVTRI